MQKYGDLDVCFLSGVTPISWRQRIIKLKIYTLCPIIIVISKISPITHHIRIDRWGNGGQTVYNYDYLYSGSISNFNYYNDPPQIAILVCGIIREKSLDYL